MSEHLNFFVLEILLLDIQFSYALFQMQLFLLIFFNLIILLLDLYIELINLQLEFIRWVEACVFRLYADALVCIFLWLRILHRLVRLAIKQPLSSLYRFSFECIFSFGDYGLALLVVVINLSKLEDLILQIQYLLEVIFIEQFELLEDLVIIIFLIHTTCKFAIIGLLEDLLEIFKNLAFS